MTFKDYESELWEPLEEEPSEKHSGIIKNSD